MKNVQIEHCITDIKIINEKIVRCANLLMKKKIPYTYVSNLIKLSNQAISYL